MNNNNNYNNSNEENDYDENNSNNYNSNMNGGRRNVTRKNRKASNAMEGGAKMKSVGSHAEVWHMKAKHTSGGLTKKDLMKNKHGRIISKKKHAFGFFLY